VSSLEALFTDNYPFVSRASIGEVWWACSGGAELMATSKQSYADYLTLAGNATGRDGDCFFHHG
jgi:hypothetical protein